VLKGARSVVVRRDAASGMLAGHPAEASRREKETAS